MKDGDVGTTNADDKETADKEIHATAERADAFFIVFLLTIGFKLLVRPTKILATTSSESSLYGREVQDRFFRETLLLR